MRHSIQELVATIDGIVWEADARTLDLLFVSQAAERILGYPVADWLRPGFWAAHLHPEDRESAVSECLRETRAGQAHEMQYRMLSADGRVVWIRDQAAVVLEDGAARWLRGIMTDVTEQQRTTAALREAKERLELAAQAAELGIWDHDLRTGAWRWDARMFELYGVSPEAFPARVADWKACVHPEDLPALEREFRAMLAAGSTWTGEYRACWPSGEVRRLRGHAIVSRDAAGAVVRLTGVVLDVTERARAQAALRESEARFQAYMDHCPLVAFLKDEAGRLVWVNRTFEQRLALRREDWFGKSDAELWPVGVAARMRRNDLQVLQSGQAQEFEESARLPDGEHHWLSYKFPLPDAAGHRHLAGMSVEVTEKRRLAAQLRQSRQMETVGTLAAGIAHDFNNILTIVNGRADLLLEDATLAPAHRAHVQQILAAGLKAAEIVRQLLSFARKQELNAERLDANEIIGGMLELLRSLLGDGVRLGVALVPNPLHVRVNRVQFEQALLNLVLNARDAVNGQGRIRITTSCSEFDQANCRQFVDGRPGRFVCVAVADDGCGMSPEVRERILEPFFTTKPVGKGSGLGLPVVFGHVQQANGWIDVQSTERVGTTVRLFFPHVDESADADA